jgi:hypothetical protein
VRDKLDASDDWECTQREQSLHELISKIECICVGFDDHKQEIFNLVQALKTIFQYTQTDKETVEEFTRNSRVFGTPSKHLGDRQDYRKGWSKGCYERWGELEIRTTYRMMSGTKQKKK